MAGSVSVLTLVVWISLHITIYAKGNGKSFSYTHPETWLPLSSGLISNTMPVLTFRDRLSLPQTTLQRSRVRRTFRSFRFQRQSPCRSLMNLLFRTADGSCNHLNNLGQSLMPMTRFLPPDYADGVQAPRNASVTDSSLPLPSARAVSRTVHRDVITSTNLTIFLMQWGQLMDHEMVSTPLPIEDTRGTVQCCGPDASHPVGNESSECFPILFSPGDPDFQGTCMELVRSEPVADRNENKILPRENENLITSFIDASTVYGSTSERQEAVRDPNKRYLLRTTDDNFPPDNGLNDCVKRDSNDICFLAGDDRVNEQPALTLIHIVLARYHNVLAKQLKYFRHRASDEAIFQQTRALVGAIMQNILFSEWLPLVLGPKVRTMFDLDVNPKGSRTVYDPSQDPRIFSAFSTAVFRFGHTLIPRSLPLSSTRRPLLRELFFKPFETRENLDSLVEGLARSEDDEDRTQRTDQFVVEEVTSHLFENQEGTMKGFDLVALNLQRGRDHGLPSYNRFREAVGLQKLTTFSDPALGTAGADLESVYAHVDDIDLFSGGMSEPVFDGGLVGETFSLLMGEQFHRLKFGDRFFFNNNRRPFGFTDYQLWTLSKVRLSHILCITTDITGIQPNVFLVEGPGNERKNCDWYKRYHPKMKIFMRYPFGW